LTTALTKALIKALITLSGVALMITLDDGSGNALITAITTTWVTLSGDCYNDDSNEDSGEGSLIKALTTTLVTAMATALIMLSGKALAKAL
jgi:hypothetical protein